MKVPYATHKNNEALWELEEVPREYYPEIFKYWEDLGETDIKIVPIGPVDEDCLYLRGKWYSYCREEWEWKLPAERNYNEAKKQRYGDK